MNPRSVLTKVLFVLTLIISSASVSEETKYAEDIRFINAQVVEKFGISLPALSYLIEHGPMEALVPECVTKATGKYGYIEELTNQSYITLTERDVPKELQEMNQGRFMKLVVTEKGTSVLEGLSIIKSEELLEAVRDLSCN